MRLKRRRSNTFSLAFLDIMSCGLGATVLLFLIVRHNLDPVFSVPESLRAETELLAEEIRIGQTHLAQIQNTLDVVTDELAIARGLARQIQEEIDELQIRIRELDPDAEESLEELQRRLSELESQRDMLSAAGGAQVRQFVGEGQRQYLTGIQMGGQRTLILVDVSASMVGGTIVDVIRRRSSGVEAMREGAKWQQTLGIADWIVANLPAESRFQLYGFNEVVTAAVPDTLDTWLSTADRSALDRASSGLRAMDPSGGTSLYRAFAAVNRLNPAPDNIFLVTDGLPNQGDQLQTSGTVSGEQRVRHYNQAVNLLPRNIPVNILLLPMEGDYHAAGAFWVLAIRSGGAFLTPAEDWP